jgi:hypothetical protein
MPQNISWMDRRAGALWKALQCLVLASMAASPAMADQVPQFNVEPGCRAAAARATTPDYAAVCMRKEQDARRTLMQSWSQFKPAQRAQCVQLTRLGASGTYTELMTCLEMARDAEALRNPPAPATTGGLSR